MPPDQEAPRQPQTLSTPEVRQQIQQGLNSEPALRNSKVGVHVDENSVILTGTVSTEEQHDLAVQIAQSYAGDRKTSIRSSSRSKPKAWGCVFQRWPVKIREIMSRDPACCVLTDTAQTVAKILCDRNIGSMPVVDEQSRKLAGVITDRDLCCSVIAQGMDPKTTTIEKLITLSPLTCREGENIETCER
jgi:CBS domain-containing protein